MARMIRAIKDCHGNDMKIGELIQYQIATSGRILRFGHGGNRSEKPPTKNVDSTGKDVPEGDWDRGPETHITVLPLSNGMYQIATSGRILRFGHGGNRSENPPTKNVDSTGKDVPENSWDRGPETHVSFIPMGNGMYQIATSGRILRFSHGGNRSRNPPSKNVNSTGKDVPENSWDRGPETHIDFLPVKYELHAKITNFQYKSDVDELLKSTAVDTVITDRTHNHLPDNVEETVERESTSSSSYTWSFKGSFSAEFSNEWTVEAAPSIGPVTIGGAKSKLSYKFGVSLENEHVTEEGKSDTVKLTKKLFVPADTSVEWTWITKKTDNAKIDFTADVQISAKAQTLDEDGRKGEMRNVPHYLLQHLIDSSGYKGEIKSKVDDYTVKAELEGQVTANCVFHSEFTSRIIEEDIV